MPKIQLPDKFDPAVKSRARIVVIIGGRGSGKSESVARLLTMRAQTEQADILCGREYQNSIDDSVHKLIKSVIRRTEAEGFYITDKKIDCIGGGGFRFKGFSRDSDAVKSAQDFKYSWIEESQSLSQQSIDDLIPTIRAEGSQLFFTANPQSSADPFSKRFILPYLPALKARGIYEDDMHLIILMNWRDNPWFPPELEVQRQWDYANLPRAKYDHIWEGEFNDSVEDSLILAEWFDACIDAHKRLGFQSVGVKIAAHDPSDEGSDSKGYCLRHGSVIHDIQERTTGNVNDGGDWATGLAIQAGVDAFTWDCDGMGIALNRQITQAFDGKPTLLSQFRGSEGVDFPDAIFDPADGAPIQDQKTNKQALRNKRAQYYFELRRRMFNTYRAVECGMYCDPEQMLALDSGISLLPSLRSEVCRLPVKPNGNGLFELYTKAEMRAKFGIKSPNLADSLMMSLRAPHRVANLNHVRPQPIRAMGRR